MNRWVAALLVVVHVGMESRIAQAEVRTKGVRPLLWAGAPSDRHAAQMASATKCRNSRHRLVRPASDRRFTRQNFT